MTPTLPSPTRFLRKLRYRLFPKPVVYVYTRAYQLELPAVPVDSLRGERVLSYLAGEGLVSKAAVYPPRPASIRSLLRVHTAEYLESLRETDTLLRVVGARFDETTLDRILDLQRTMCGGTTLACRLARTSGRVAVHLGGGFHHAFADKGERFCVLNDVAVAIESARAHGFEGRILVVDLDVHDGDGTRSIFAHDRSVHTFSIHNQTNRPDSGLEATAIELGHEVEDSEYLDALEAHLPPVMESFRPELVFYLAGTDPACDDRIGDWEITAEAMLHRDRFVTECARAGASPRHEGIPLVVVLGGGYGKGAWRYIARYCAWLTTGGEVPEPPSTEEVTLARYRLLAKLLSPRELSGTPGDADRADDWNLTAEDVMGALAGSPTKTRFLDFYTQHGIELALERSGVLDRIRALGFQPSLEMDLTNPAGQTLRLFGDRQQEELLMELRARRDGSSVKGMEVLRVEWLLLQNPRAHFTERKPRLPGQEHPGLGMLKDASAFLVLACERLGLDGVLFTPSHYHLAAQSREYLRFVDPREEARFRAFQEALEPLPLVEATRVADEGGLVDADTGEAVAWDPSVMILPVSGRARERFLGEGYESRVQEAVGELELERGEP